MGEGFGSGSGSRTGLGVRSSEPVVESGARRPAVFPMMPRLRERASETLQVVVFIRFVDFLYARDMPRAKNKLSVDNQIVTSDELVSRAMHHAKCKWIKRKLHVIII